MLPQPTFSAFDRWRATPRDWFILFLLLLASVQLVRADFLDNETFIDWQSYAAGTEAMPYQGRIGMMPVLRFAEASPRFRSAATRFAESISVASKHQEPITVEKVASLAAGLVAILLMLAVTLWFSHRHALRPWWSTSLLFLFIAAVTLTLRATHNFWYAYDLPHAALFGCAILCAMESVWPLALLFFLADLPMRETSLFLVPIFAALLWVQSPGRRALLRIGAMLLPMLTLWLVLRLYIGRHFAGHGSDTASHLRENFHDLLRPDHWPQLFSLGGYVAVFIWLERRRLTLRHRSVLYAALLCAPVTLLFGVWAETRVWLEWTLPLAALGALEVDACLERPLRTEPAAS